MANRTLSAFILITVILWTHHSARAEHVRFADVEIDIPESIEFRFDSVKSAIGFHSNTGEGALCTFGDASISRKVDFNVSTILAELHTRTFNLSEAELISEEVQESSPNFRNVYARRIYRNKQNTAAMGISYTFITPNRPYTMFVAYRDSLPSEFGAIIDSIRPKISIWDDVSYQFKNGWHVLLLAFFAAMILGHSIGWFVNRDYQARKIMWIVSVGTIAATIYFTPGCWALWLSASPFVLLSSYMGAITSFEDLVTETLKNI